MEKDQHAYGSDREHPLIAQGLPDWLASVPMDAKKPVFIPVGEGKSAPLDLILEALEEEVGTELGRMAIAPELAEHFAQFTENPSWKNLPTEVTSIKRTDEETWEVTVGEFSRSFTKDELRQQVKQALSGESENQS